mmetsp:Transcript_26894/g.84334  ORF Transcript_26894/g.84334 Transcript_26894/m.84334 type:complete len:231 (-) Transcript_26894:1103-1795(-)
MRPAPLLKLRQLAEVLDPPRNATAAAAAAATRGGGGGWCALLPRRAHAREERGRVVHVHRRRLRVRVGRALVLRLRLLLGVLEREGYDLVALGAEATLVNRVELLPLVRHAHRNLLRHPALGLGFGFGLGLGLGLSSGLGSGFGATHQRCTSAMVCVRNMGAAAQVCVTAGLVTTSSATAPSISRGAPTSRGICRPDAFTASSARMSTSCPAALRGPSMASWQHMLMKSL